MSGLGFERIGYGPALDWRQHAEAAARELMIYGLDAAARHVGQAIDRTEDDPDTRAGLELAADALASGNLDAAYRRLLDLLDTSQAAAIRRAMGPTGGGDPWPDRT